MYRTTWNRSFVSLLILSALLALLLLSSTGCSNFRGLWPTGPDRAVKTLSGAELRNSVVFEGLASEPCTEYRASGQSPYSARSESFVGGCILAVRVSGEDEPRRVICPLGELMDRCKRLGEGHHRVAFTGTVLNADGIYLPRGTGGLKARSIE